MARYTLNNNLTPAICEVYINAESSWDSSNNLLSSGETISNGSSRMFEVTDGTYDVLFKLTNGDRYRKPNVAIFGDIDENTDEYDLIDDDLD